ncbi:MAG: AbrB/MazE/SpoVT family DNA-binding domain-containing protein [Bacilli bacterium]|nr:AbrB/MazE/SpoVT family DNA-binding domain-containing protein [Bacilli bacterium]
MKSTGITRRIDDLGRIVIPKEIRKNLKIKENEILEIFIDNEEIILKKYSSFSDMEKVLFNFVDTLYKITGNNIFITDRDKIIACQENKKLDYLNKNVGDTINYVIDSRMPILSNEKSDLYLKENESLNINYYIIPIITNSDILGVVVMLSNNKINEVDKLSLEIVSKLISNYIE